MSFVTTLIVGFNMETVKYMPLSPSDHAWTFESKQIVPRDYTYLLLFYDTWCYIGSIFIINVQSHYAMNYVNQYDFKFYNTLEITK